MTEARCSRRDALRAGARWLLVPTTGTLVAVVADPAAAKVSKADVFYRDTPKDGRSCAACRLFSPGESGLGMCAVVEGPVSANGWCMAFSARTQ